MVLGLEQSGKPIVLGEAVEYNKRLRGVLEWLCESDVGADVDWLRRAL